MSSILDSLKKLENELTEQSKVQFRPQKRPVPKEAIPRRLKSTRFFNKLCFVIFAVIFSAGGIWFILNGKPGENAPGLVAKTETKPEKFAGLAKEKAALSDLTPKKMSDDTDAEQSESLTKKAKVASISARNPREKAPASVARTQIKPEKSTGLVKEKASTLDLTQNKMSDNADAEQSESLTKKAKVASISARNPREKAPASVAKPAKPLSRHEQKASLPDLLRKKTPTPKNVTNDEQNTKAKRVAAIPVKQDGESQLRIQAIAWSSDPKDRIAVINDRIVREGESVEGVFVTRIGKDEVIFRKGSEEWRQLFRL